MFPYLTIVQKSPGESVREVTDRVALIAYIVLSSHVKALKGLGRSDQLLACLRHYVIAVDPDRLGYEVYEAKQDPDGLTGYLVSSIDGGDLNNGAERFSLWLDMIHEWAEKTWKPMMMEAFSPEYLHYRNPVPQAGAKNEVENVWAQ